MSAKKGWVQNPPPLTMNCTPFLPEASSKLAAFYWLYNSIETHYQTQKRDVHKGENLTCIGSMNEESIFGENLNNFVVCDGRRQKVVLSKIMNIQISLTVDCDIEIF